MELSKLDRVKYTNDVIGTEKSVMFMEVSSIQGCPYIEGFHCTL